MEKSSKSLAEIYYKKRPIELIYISDIVGEEGMVAVVKYPMKIIWEEVRGPFGEILYRPRLVEELEPKLFTFYDEKELERLKETLRLAGYKIKIDENTPRLLGIGKLHRIDEEKGVAYVEYRDMSKLDKETRRKIYKRANIPLNEEVEVEKVWDMYLKNILKSWVYDVLCCTKYKKQIRTNYSYERLEKN